jgi:uncharacterized protein YndB with AHSA1/START domain
MEYGSIEREFHVDASPDVVFDVISSPEHIREWWNAETDLEPVPGAVGELSWSSSDSDNGRAMVVPITVVDAQPPHLFSFRWTHPSGEAAAPGNSLLVTFELAPSGGGTSVRLTEVGFREMGWEAAVLEAQYREHAVGWEKYLAQLRDYLTRLASTP